MTTFGTLSSAGESFFTSLLSGRHKNPTDSTGALFVDRESVDGIRHCPIIVSYGVLHCPTLLFYSILCCSALSCV